MAHDYQSFLVRCWQLGDGSRRIAVEHVQSGERTLVATLDDATAWLNTCVGIGWHEEPPLSGGTVSSPDTPPPRPPGDGIGRE